MSTDRLHCVKDTPESSSFFFIQDDPEDIL